VADVEGGDDGFPGEQWPVQKTGNALDEVHDCCWTYYEVDGGRAGSVLGQDKARWP
jgi:hypothetical protein